MRAMVGILAALAVSGAEAYTCAELNEHNRTPPTAQQLNGFPSVDEKLTAIKSSFFIIFPKQVARRAFDEHTAAKDVRDPYGLSLEIYRDMLPIAFETEKRINAEIARAGGINAFFSKFCKNPDWEVEGILRSFFIKVQEKMAE